MSSIRSDSRSAPSKRSAKPLPGSKPYAVPAPGSLRGIMAEVRQLPNVLGCFVGRKLRKGRHTKQLVLCVLVSEKYASKALDPSHRIPEEIPFQLSAKRGGKLRTDVIPLKSPFVRAQAPAMAGPGDRITSPQPGTVGIVMQHPEYGRVVTSAGHVFVSESWRGTSTFAAGNLPPVSLSNAGGQTMAMQGELLKVVVEPRADYALVRPLNVEAYNAFQDQLFLRSTYVPTGEETGQRLFVLTERGMIPTTFRGVQGSLRVGPMVMERVLLTDYCTQGGDSGACLIDEQGRVWGLLLGFNDQYSVVMYADIALFDERADYV
jgi:hypothetical protein